LNSVKSVERVIRHCIEGVQDCERNWNLIPFWLASPECGKPFRSFFKDNTIERYVDYWQQLICFCLRILGEEEIMEFNSERRKSCTWKSCRRWL